MRPEEYRQIIKSLETHFEEFKVSCSGSQMFAEEDKRSMENQFNGAQNHYEQLVVQLPTYSEYYTKYTGLLRGEQDKLLIKCLKMHKPCFYIQSTCSTRE